MTEAAPLIGIIMGSRSDWETMREASATLATLQIPHECKVVSAHRTPERLYDYAKKRGWAWLEMHHCWRRRRGTFARHGGIHDAAASAWRACAVQGAGRDGQPFIHRPDACRNSSWNLSDWQGGRNKRGLAGGGNAGE